MESVTFPGKIHHHISILISDSVAEFDYRKSFFNVVTKRGGQDLHAMRRLALPKYAQNPI